MIFLNKKNCAELLSPVGTRESLYSAVNNGCDAIYLGGKKFNARKYASNFSDEELIEIIDFCHIRGVKVLITLNILYKDCEINDVLKFVSKMYSAGVDAFIVQDLGIFSILKKIFPEIRLHASTQMTAHNIHTVKFLEKLGYARVVLSRELSMNEIENICNNTSCEIEVFIHGALCVSYSGRCLMSSLIGERSGNRGQCAQPCRLKYAFYKNGKKIAENYLLSPRDIMSLDFIDNLVNSGVKSFKIEGRMKSPEYVAQVTKTYRKYIDLSVENSFSSPLNEDIEKLTQIFNRGGNFSTGYLRDWAGTKMISPSPKSSGIKIGIVESYNKSTGRAIISLSKPVTAGDGIEIWTNKAPHVGTGISKSAYTGEKISVNIKGNISKGNLVYKSFDKLLNDELKKEYQKDTRKREIFAYVCAKTNSNLKIKLVCPENTDIYAELTGPIIQKAEKNPISKEDLVKRLSKTGETPFILSFKEVVCDDDIYLPIGEINAFRREAIALFTEKIVSNYKRDSIDVSYKPKDKKYSAEKFITVHLSTKEQFLTAINHKIKRIYFELNNTLLDNLENYIDLAHKNNIEFFICMPRIYREPFFKKFEQLFKRFEESSADGYLLRNFQELNTNKKIVADYTFNIFNSASATFMENLFDTITLSPELTINELKNIADENSEIFTYGRLTLMTTHQCPVGLYDAKKETGMFCKLKDTEGNYFIKDRMGVDFPIQRDCLTCTSFILNSVPVCILSKFDELNKINPKYLRITLTNENKSETDDILYSHIKLLSDNTEDKRVKATIENIREKGFTTGHLFKGIL